MEHIDPCTKKPVTAVKKIERGPPKAPKLLQKSLKEYYLDRVAEEASEQKDDYLQDISYTPATEMEKARREMYCLDRTLLVAREVWNQERKVFNERWRVAQEGYAEVFENIPKFNSFYLESFRKIARLHETFLRERANCAMKDRDIRRLTKELEAVTRVREVQARRLERFEVFKVYLAKVLESSNGEYKDLKEVMDRYWNLSEATGALAERSNEGRDEISRTQKALEASVNNKSTEVVLYRNFLTELIEYFDAIKEETQRLESSLLRIKTTAAKRTMVIGQIKMSIDNLYRQMCRQMHRAARIPPSDTIGQLEDVHLSVRELVKLSRDIKHMLKVAFLTSEAERGANVSQKRRQFEAAKKMDDIMVKKAKDVRALFSLPPLRKQTAKARGYKTFNDLFGGGNT